MEFFLRFLFMPVSFVASIVFCLLMRAALLKWPKISPLCQRLAAAGAAAVVLCIAVSIWPGVATLNQNWPLLYGIAYRVCFLIGPPVVATLLIAYAVKKKKGWLATFLVPSIACFAVCGIFLFGDIFVYEAAFGPS